MIFFIKIIKHLRTYTNTSNSSFFYVILFAIILNFLFGTLFYVVEDQVTFLDSIWWAMVTMTTVGYGDFYAKTVIGRFLISYPTMLLGIGLIGYLVGITADFILQFSALKRRGLMDIDFSDHIIIANFPGVNKISNLISQIRQNPDYRNTKVVLISDKIEELPDELSKSKITFLKGFPANEDILLKANILNCKGIVVLTENPNDPNSDSKNYAIGSLVEILEKENKKPIKSVVELIKKENIKLMKRANVDGIVASSGFESSLLAQEFLYPGLNDVILQVITNQENEKGSQFYLYKTILDNFPFKKLQIEVLKNYDSIQVVGIIQKGKKNLNPDKNTIIHKNDELVILAENKFDMVEIEKKLKL